MTSSTESTGPLIAEPRWRSVLAGAAIVLAALAAYHNSLSGPFIFDDPPSIAENPTLRAPRSLLAAWSPPTHATVGGRPVVNFSFALNYALGGTRVGGYHAANVLIHVLAGLALFGVVRRTLRGSVGAQACCALEGGRSKPAPLPSDATLLALAVALLWTVHPLQTEAVTYTVQRTESLMGLFYLLTLYCFIRGVTCHSIGDQSGQPSRDAFAVCHVLRDKVPGGGRRIWLAFSVLACLLGMACKEVMVSAPAMVLLYDRTFVVGTFREAWRRRRPLYLGLAATWLPLTYLVASTGWNRAGSTGIGSGATIGEYALTQFPAVVHYLWLCLWPHPLVLDYGAEWVKDVAGIAPAILILVLSVAGTLLGLKRRTASGFLGAWFIAVLAPTSLIPGARQTMAEHRMYLALAAVVTMVVLGLHAWGGRRMLVAWFALAIGLGWLTVRRNGDYRSELSIWSDTVAKRPGNRWAHSLLGMALYNQGRVNEALSHIEQALRLGPDDARPHNDMGIMLARLGRLPEAVDQYEAALRLRPAFPEAHNNLANAVVQLPGHLPEALAHYAEALRLDPGNPETHTNLANALAKLPGRLPEALAHYAMALRLDPGNPEIHFCLANTLASVPGREAEARAEYEETLRLRPGYVEAHNNLADLLAKQPGGVPGALAHYEEALRLRRDLAKTHYNFAVALEKVPGRTAEALAHYQEAVRLDPGYAEAHNNLAILYAQGGQLEQARQHWEMALQLKPGYEDARKNLQKLEQLERR